MTELLAFADAGCRDVDQAGGKGASLARMAGFGLPVPPGFVVPAGVLAELLEDGGADLRAAVSEEGGAERAQAIVAGLTLPDALRAAIAEAYTGLGETEPPVAVRSSACAEDSEAASFAGQQETYLHVRGGEAVADRVRDCWGSFFSERAIFYRGEKGSLDDLGMAVVVQRMVDADVAGVLFTCDPVRGRRDRMVVEAVLGLGEGVVSGRLTPDQYVLARDGRVKRERVHEQPFAIVADPEGGVTERELDPGEGGERKLGDEHLAALAKIGDDLETRLGGPQDIEWAVQDGELFVLQARPVTA
jgi:pyruvate,water dikinase